MDKFVIKNKILAVKKAEEEVKKEIGENYQHLSIPRRCVLIREKLPTKPIYEVGTIRQILSDNYCK